MIFVNDYLNSIKNKNPRNTRGNKALLNNLLLLVLIFVSFLPFVFSIPRVSVRTIRDKFDFDFCEFRNELRPVNIDD